MSDTILAPVSPTRLHPAPQWTLRPTAPPQVVAKLARDLGVPPLLAGILWSRGLQGEALDALKPPLTLTEIPDLHEAARRLEHALKGKKRILIHGDYDADGISGAAVLTLGLRALGGKVTPFIPNRLSDGYGIHPERVLEHIERADLFITVDCGISNLQEIEALQKAGVEVIVSDHHQPGQTLPNCLIVHPKMSPLAQKGLPELTGAGVAYHLLWALHERLGLEPPLEYSDLATIGTIADVAPLMGENRALIQEGLARLPDSKWPGLRAMTAQNGLRKGVSARDVAFVIAPRLNAAGRLGEADLGLELLTTASERRARELAAYLDARNSDRRKIQDEMFKEALELVDQDAPALVLGRESWHPGVMGIVASKLLERFYKPVFIIAQGKGSVRSTPGISAVEGLQHARAHLERFGGHSMAAGFAILDENIAHFRKSICDYVRSFPTPCPSVTVDALLSAADIDRELFEGIGLLEPYGEGHPAPLFALTDTLDMARAVGRDSAHLQLRIGGVKGISWQKGHIAAQFKRGNPVNAAVSLQENTWQGKTSIEFLAEEVREAEPLHIVRTAAPEKSEHEIDDVHASPSPLPSPLITRGTPPADAQVTRIHGKLPDALSPDTAYWLTSLPLDTAQPLKLCSPLEQLLQTATTLHVDLGDGELRRLAQLAAQYPTMLELRHAFVWLQRGQRLPFDDVKEALCKKALGELELLDARGFPRKGQKRDPYSSDTLLSGLVERYKLRTLLNAYRTLDDASFAQTVITLFQKSAS